jgi:SAM-dependent methyltransferase
MGARFDFGYPWWLSYGHLVLFAIAVLLFALARWRRWSMWVRVPLAAFVLWTFAGFLTARFVLGFNERGSLPTESFLRSGSGRILDIGAGTGRSSIMVLEARPQITLVALDQFGDSFEHHFGSGLSPQDRLLANLRAAGVDGRVTVQTADMRQLPFGAGEFDAIVSAYAIDHLNSKGIDQSLHEAARVVKPGGEFLLMLVGKEPWVQFAFGPLLSHAGLRDAAWWTSHLEQAGFRVSEQGKRPATLYLLSKKT